MKKLETNQILINDPRKEIANIFKEKETISWKESSQGLVVRPNSALEMLNKWKKETLGSAMESFGLILWTQLFPTTVNFKKIASKKHLWLSAAHFVIQIVFKVSVNAKCLGKRLSKHSKIFGRFSKSSERNYES